MRFEVSMHDIGMIWEVGIQSELLGGIDVMQLSERLGLPREETRAIVDTLIQIGFYDPTTGRKDWSALPEMEWSGPMSAEEMDCARGNVVPGLKGELRPRQEEGTRATSDQPQGTIA